MDLFRLLKKLLYLPLLAAIFQITSCIDGYEYDGTDYEVLGGGVVNDTTAIILRTITDHYYKEGLLSGWKKSELREFSVNLVDIRFEKIYWKKEIINYNDNVSGSLRVEFIDSTFFLYAGKRSSNAKNSYGIGRIATIHIDERFHHSEKIVLKYKDIELKGKGWGEYSYPYPKVRPWKDGLILAYRVDAGTASPYALLDTIAGTTELWQPSGEFEWLNECTDYKLSQIDGLCLKNISDTLDTSNFVLLRNSIDTLAVRHNPSFGWRGLYFHGNAINSAGWIYLIGKQGQVSEKPLGVRGMAYKGFFTDLNENVLADYSKPKNL